MTCHENSSNYKVLASWHAMKQLKCPFAMVCHEKRLTRQVPTAPHALPPNPEDAGGYGWIQVLVAGLHY